MKNNQEFALPEFQKDLEKMEASLEDAKPYFTQNQPDPEMVDYITTARDGVCNILTRLNSYQQEAKNKLNAHLAEKRKKRKQQQRQSEQGVVIEGEEGEEGEEGKEGR
jgi:hypothetical protein